MVVSITLVPERFAEIEAFANNLEKQGITIDINHIIEDLIAEKMQSLSANQIISIWAKEKSRQLRNLDAINDLNDLPKRKINSERLVTPEIYKELKNDIKPYLGCANEALGFAANSIVSHIGHSACRKLIKDILRKS